MVRIIVSLLIGAALVAAGCLKRTEGIIIAPDGSARLMVHYEGHLSDLQNGDAMPSPETGWRIQDKIETKDNDKQDIERVGVSSVAIGAPWPDSYAAPGSDAYKVGLQFPTSLEIQQRHDGTYYHFRRTYLARRAARIRFLNESILEDEKIQELAGKKPHELTDEERQKLASALLRFEAEKTITFIDQAGFALDGEIPSPAWLPVRPKVRAIYNSDQLLAQALKLIESGDTDDMGPELERLEQDVLNDVSSTIEETLRDNGLSRGAVDRFLEAYRLAREAYTITEDLSDEEWRVCIQMPGRIIAYNGDYDDVAPLPTPTAETAGNQPDETGPGEPGAQGCLWDDTIQLSEPLFCQLIEDEFTEAPDRCCWTFPGDALLDYDVVIMATSFVPHDE
jgi:hypothetical protein